MELLDYETFGLKIEKKRTLKHRPSIINLALLFILFILSLIVPKSHSLIVLVLIVPKVLTQKIKDDQLCNY